MLIYLSKLHRSVGYLGSFIGRTASLSLDHPKMGLAANVTNDLFGTFTSNVYLGAEIAFPDTDRPTGMVIPIWKSVEMYRPYKNDHPVFVERYFVEDKSPDNKLRPTIIPFAAKHRSSNDVYTVVFYRNISRILQMYTGDSGFKVTDPRFAALNVLEQRNGAEKTHILQMGDIARRNPLVGNVGFASFSSNVVADQITKISTTGSSPLLNNFTVGDISWQPIRHVFPQVTDMAPTVFGTHDTSHDLLSYMQTIQRGPIDTTIPLPLDVDLVEDSFKTHPSHVWMLEELSHCLATEFDVSFTVFEYGLTDMRHVHWAYYVDRYTTPALVSAHRDKDVVHIQKFVDDFIKTAEIHARVRGLHDITNCIAQGRCRVRIVKTFGEEICASLDELTKRPGKEDEYSPLFVEHFDIAAATLCSEGISPIPFESYSVSQQSFKGVQSLGHLC